MITITIRTGNAAFADLTGYSAEVARILHKIAEEYEEYGRAQFAKLYDVNGNRVGTVTLTGRDKY